MSIEEIIKVLGEIAEGHEKLSADVCARADIKAMWEGHAKGIRQSIALLKAHLDAKPNDPLTLEELRKMDGDPVWICRIDGRNGCYTVVASSAERCGNYWGSVHFKNYGKVWLAYRRRPKEVN